MNEDAFNRAIEIVRSDYQDSGIGTYSEKMTHRVLKYYINSDSRTHEIRLAGCIADVIDESGVIHEIQSKDLYKLKDKISRFMETHIVEIVYPVVVNKIIFWVNKQTNQIESQSKSSKHIKPGQILTEMYGLRDFLDFSGIKFRAIVIEEIEYKYLDGYGPNNRSGATKINKIPSKLIDDIHLWERDDFRKLVPSTLSNEFTADDYKKKSGLNLDDSRKALLVLMKLGIVDRIGKSGRKYMYKIT